MLNSILVVALLASSITAHVAKIRRQQIQWSPCDLNGTLPTECAKFPVPLDYSNPDSSQMLDLQLVKVAASKTPSKGSILTNFGGPGAPGVSSMASLAAQLQAYTGGYHDLISFDPRGTGDTMTFSCYENDAARAIAVLTTMPQKFGNASDVTLGELWGQSKLTADACYARLNETGRLVGTAFVARDMMQIVDELEEDGLLRYWGFSYGTILGATVVAMFPGRMDKIVLDGVVNPHDYYHNPGQDVSMFTQADAAFSGMASNCLATPELCPLARDNMTAEELEKSIFDFIDHVKYNPIPIKGALLDYTSVKGLTYYGIKTPELLPALTSILNDLMMGNITSVDTLLALLRAAGDTSNESIFGIKCSDQVSRTSSLHLLRPSIDYVHETSRFGDLSDILITPCARWSFEAKERYLGDFKVKTPNPVLVIGNTFDPATVVASAHNVSAGFEGSVVLEQKGYGHCTIAQPSICTAKAIAAYFVNGTIPEKGAECGVDVDMFTTKTWENVFNEAGYI